MKFLRTDKQKYIHNDDSQSYALDVAVDDFKSMVEQISKPFFGDIKKRNGSIKNAVAKIENKLSKTIRIICENNTRNTLEEVHEAKKWRKVKKEWQNSHQKLFKMLNLIVKDLRNNTYNLMKDKDLIIIPTELKKFLLNQKKSIKLIIKMLERLNEYEINGLKVDIKRIKLKYNFALPKVDLLLHEFNIDKKELVQQFSAQAVACIDKAVTLFNKNRNDNYNVIREEKLRAEAWRKNTIDLIRHYILPPIDGIERGMADGKEFIKKIPKSYIKYDKTIKRWLGVIALAYNRIKKSLSNAGIDLIEPGNDFNPEIHFPISTEESPDLPDGKILCVIRNGFIYKGIQVRPVEVVVVKNKKSFKEGDSGG